MTTAFQWSSLSRISVSFCAIFLLSYNNADGKCPDGSEAGQQCLLHSDCNDEKEMCLNGECCSVLGDSMPCSLFSYREYAMQDSYNDTCNVDNDCPVWWKCCQTIIGKYCMEPEPEQSRCEDGNWPAALCLDGVSCPDGYECNADLVCCKMPRWKQRRCTVNMTESQLEELQTCDILAHCQLGENCCQTKAGYRCVPFTARILSRGQSQKSGSCPLYLYDYLDAKATDTCDVDDDCPADRKCCQTVAGRYCLLPDAKKYTCKDGKEPTAICQTKCPNNHACVDSFCCPT